MVNNLPEERRKLAGEIWKYLIEVELKTNFQDYEKRKNDLGKAIQAIESQIRSEKEARDLKHAEIRQLEKQTTSIQWEAGRYLAGIIGICER